MNDFLKSLPPPQVPGAGPPAPTPDPPREGATWSPTAAILGFLGVIVIIVVFVNIAVALGADPEEQGVDLLLQAALAVSLVAVPLAVASWGQTGLREAAHRLGLRRMKLEDVGWAFAAYGVFFVVLIIYGVIVQPDPQDTVEVIADERDTMALIALGALVVIAAPVSEEIFFRGFFFGALRAKMPFWGAALISGLVFGLVHIPSGIAQAPPLALLGVVLAWLYERTGSLGAPMIMHGFQNLVAFTYTVASN